MSRSFASRLKQNKIVLAPGVYDAFSSSVAADAGFEAVYLSGAAIAYTLLGRPDIGLVSLTEVAQVMGRIRERIDLPVIIDGDTGWGNALNVQRTVRLFEQAGATAIQLEDQTYPKRCGHLKGKDVISVGEAVGKIKAAVDARKEALIVARTDAIAIEGFERALDRAERYLEAGADILFIEAMRDSEQMRIANERFKGRVPLLANMVEGGNTPLASAAELEAMGFGIVIFPGAVVRALARTLQEFYGSLKTNGTTAPFMPRMFDFTGLNNLIGTDGILAAGKAYEYQD